MYRLNNAIRIKTCKENSFLINIKTNSIIMITTDAKDFLLEQLSKGLSEGNIAEKCESFVGFIDNLLKTGVLEEISDEA